MAQAQEVVIAFSDASLPDFRAARRRRGDILANARYHFQAERYPAVAQARTPASFNEDTHI